MNPIQEYLSLAEKQYALKTDKIRLPLSIASLPTIDETLLATLALRAEELASSTPGLGWTLMHIARLAVNAQTNDLWLQSLSAWYDGRAANRWIHPLLVKAPLQQARRGFITLGRPEWVAACDWQLNDQPIIIKNYVQSEKILQRALISLKENPLDNLSAFCRLSLALIQINLNKADEAFENVQKSITYFSQKKDELGLAQCWLMEASAFRNKNKYFEAISKIDQALNIFHEYHQDQFVAKCYLHYGYCSLYGTTDIDLAADHFQKADALFQKCDQEIYHGICRTWLGITWLQTGKLETVETSFKEAESIYRKHHVLNLLADNYTSNGLFCLSKGDLQRSVHYFQKAQKLHQNLGSMSNTANDLMNLGKAYNTSGYYQDALLTLEAAREKVLEINNSLLVANCEANMAFTWFSLRNFDKSFQHLLNAQNLYQENHQNSTITTMNNLKARIYFEKGNYEATMNCLQESLDRSLKYGLRQQAALAHRQIGELLLHLEQYVEAESHLHGALNEFSEMGMPLEQAACMLVLGDCIFGQADLEKAAKYYQEALEISSGVFYEIDWGAEAGLAHIAEMRNQPENALLNYRKAINSLSKIRDNFWQASLAGSYANLPSDLFSNAISLALILHSPLDVIRFIEADKANSLIQQFNIERQPKSGKKSQILENLRHEVNWLQNQLNQSDYGQNNLQYSLRTRQFRQQLIEKSSQYDQVNAIQERRQFSRKIIQPSQSLDQENICSTFQPLLGETWLALDYYMQGKNLFIAAISNRSNTSFSLSLTPRAETALESVKLSQQNGRAPDESDLRVLGKSLLPAAFMETLQLNTCLIISPHSLLHGIPWNALQPVGTGGFLVEKCIPVIVPSLRAASFIWNKNKSNESLARQKGIVVGLSDFNGLHPALPFVRNEVESFRSHLTDDGRIFSEKEANWENLTNLSRFNSTKGLSGFSFLHIASHFFADSVSGRLSGLALWGEDIYQNRLRELTLLPEMVTLSGCSSVYTRNYPGDEPVGLPTTCLLAGAKSIIGSNWPVRDESSAHFMADFYKNYFDGLSPALALSVTQRNFIHASKEISSWAGYSCIGRY
jgi:CHAT domain-containing protein